MVHGLAIKLLFKVNDVGQQFGQRVGTLWPAVGSSAIEIYEPCSELLAAPVDSVLGGADHPPAGKAEDPDLIAKREEELSPAELLEKRRLVLEAQTVRHKMTNVPKNKWCPVCMEGEDGAYPEPKQKAASP
mgnify:CR=1 FL=1